VEPPESLHEIRERRREREQECCLHAHPALEGDRGELAQTLPADGQDDRPDLDCRQGISGAGEDERKGGKNERQGEQGGLGQSQGPQAGQGRQRSEPQRCESQGRERPDGQQADREDEPDGQDELEARVEAVDDAVAG
jgi:hypothetical protein